MTGLRKIAILGALAGCSESEERPYLYPPEPFPCEDNLDSRPTFTFPFALDRQTLDSAQTDVPVFELVGPDGPVPIFVEVRDFIGIVITPEVVLLPDRDFTLDLVDRAGLGTATEIPAMFPARYTTRNVARIRVVRAQAGRVTISFSQALDPDSVAANVSFPGGTRVAQYFDTDFHQIYFETADSDQPITVTFGPGLRTARGLVVTQDPIMLVPRDATFVADGCFL
jgi:hypothetical protein